MKTKIVYLCIGLMLGGCFNTDTNTSSPEQKNVAASQVASNNSQYSNDEKLQLEKAKSLYREKRYSEAIPLLEELAKKGNEIAQFILASTYETGEGNIKQDLKLAEKWYLMNESADGLMFLGEFYLRNEINIDKGISALEKSAKLGNDESMYVLGMIYKKGLYNIPKDATKAEKFLQDAAQKGNIHAKEELSKN